MNKDMIFQLEKVKKEGTMYFRNRELQTDKLDGVFYQTVHDFMETLPIMKNMKKGEQYLLLLKAWYYSCCRLKEKELNETRKEGDILEELETFYEIFVKHTSSYEVHEQIEALYRFPWHLQQILIASKGRKFNTYFIEQVAGLEELTQLSNGELCYFEIKPNRETGIVTLAEILREEDEDILSTQLRSNLHTIIHSFENIDKIVEAGMDAVQEEDEYAINIIAIIFHHYRKLSEKEKSETTMFDFNLLAISTICFWHFEATSVKSSWYIKEGKFQFLKRHQAEMNLAKLE